MTWVEMGLKMSHIHPFGHHNWTRISFGKPCFLPAFWPFVVPIWPISKALSALRGAKIAQHGLKMGSFHFIVHPKGAKIIFGKTHFCSPFDPFFVPKVLFQGIL